MSNPKLKPLMLACQNNESEQLKLLLNQNYPVDEKDSNNRTALFYCANQTNLKCIAELVKAKADLNIQDKDGFTALHAAIILGNLKICEYLVRHGADINLTDSELHSVVHWSVVCGHDNLLNFLLKNNAEIEIADIHGAYPIHYAAQMCGQVDIWDHTISRDSTKSLKILKKLLEHNVKVDAEDFDQRNAIIWAASSGSSEAIIELYKAGSDPNKHEKDGLTALHCASSRGYIDCIKVLIEICKVSVDIMDNNNCTPIFYAATLGQDKACELLIRYGSNLHVQDCKGRTIYHCAAAKGKYSCLDIICKLEPNIWLRNRRGDYPIQEAYYNKQHDCVYLFLDRISNKRAAKSVNMYDDCSMLHNAAAENDLKLCKRLISEGVDVNCLMKTYSSGYLTALDVAELKNAKECFDYLVQIGGVHGYTVADSALNLTADLNKMEIKQEKSAGKRRLDKYLTMNRVNEIELDDDDNVFGNDNLKYEKSMSLDRIDFSNQTDLNEKKTNNTSENLIKAIQPEQVKENPKKHSLIYRDRSAQTVLCSTKQELILVEQNNVNKNEEEVEVEYPEEFSDEDDENEQAEEKTLKSKEITSFQRTKTLLESKKSKIKKIKELKKVDISDDEFNKETKNKKVSDENEEKQYKKREKKNKSKIQEKKDSIDEEDDENVYKSKTYKKSKYKSTIEYTNQNDTNINIEESTVRLIFQTDELKNTNFSKKYLSLYERQRLLLKSLYDIRRYRLNNRDIIINSDLNNLLIKSYNFDIKKNCKSLKDLEKMLELLAQEISEEYRRQNRRSQTLLSIKKNTGNILPNKRLQSEKPGLSRSNEILRLKNEQNLQSAYKPLLPNDIYRQYFNTKTKATYTKDNLTPREKTLILPIISQKTTYSNMDKSFLC